FTIANTCLGLYEISLSFARQHWSRLIFLLMGLPISWLAAYWWSAGAWCRSAWGGVPTEQRHTALGSLGVKEARRMTAFTVVGLACVVALLVALAIQVVIA